MSGTITVIDRPTKQIFSVEIARDKLWGSVKDAIKKEPEFDDIAANTLDLWKVPHCAISQRSCSTLNLKGHDPSFPTLLLRFFEKS